MTTDMLEGFKMELAQQGKTLMDFMLEQKTDEKQLCFACRAGRSSAHQRVRVRCDFAMKALSLKSTI